MHLPTQRVRGLTRSRLPPAMASGPRVYKTRIETLASALQLPAPGLSDDVDRVLWTTPLLAPDRLGVTV